MLTTLLLASALGAAPSEAPITKQNWEDHPRIAAIRALVQRAEENIQSRRFKHEERTLCELPGGGAETQSADRDQRGDIRKLVQDFGSSDSAYHVETYYDEHGKLRFAFARRGAVNGASTEFRVYFDQDGKKLWTDTREKGPGYTWIADFPGKWLTANPEQAWKNPPACE